MCVRLWYKVDITYKTTIVDPNMVKLETCQADPCKAENTINNTKAPIASNAPIPWVIAFAISSRFREATDFINSKISSKYKFIF